jgi:quinol monooxygenase YgiN
VIIVRISMKALVGKKLDVMQTLLSMSAAARKEKGCLSYDAFCDINGKTVFYLIEEWQKRADLVRHIRSERFSVLLGTRSLLTKPLEMKIHTISRSEGVEVVNALRNREPSENHCY